MEFKDILNNDDLYTADEYQRHANFSFNMILITIPTYILTQFVITAPFGKHAISINSNTNCSLKSWLFGPRLNARLSWTLFEIPNVIWSIIGFMYRNENVIGKWTNDTTNTTHPGLFNANSILLGLFFMHYFNRSIIYPLRMSKKSQPVPILVTITAFLYTNFNGYLQAQNLCHFQKYANDYHKKPYFLFSILVFFLGFYINLQSDSILRNLREQGKGYQIPRGGLFEYVSGANHFGEILEWFGYAMASGFSVAPVAFFIYTCGNLIPRAVSTHEWYQTKFEDYPKHRKAVIPLIY